MPLTDRQAAQLIAAGAVSIPPNYPALGRLTRTEGKGTGPVICVEHRVSPVQVNRYFVQIEEVRDALRSESNKRDIRTCKRRFGEEAREDLKKLPLEGEGKRTTGKEGAVKFEYGIVFVREQAGILMQTDKAMTAGEVAAIPKGCEEDPEKEDIKEELT
jgi:hypothetical protein